MGRLAIFYVISEKGIKCNYVRFRKQGPKNLDDLHILFDKFHVSSATAT